jgi:hypothetical protein
MRYWLGIILIAFTPWFAVGSEEAAWECRARTTLRGDQVHFFTYGRDAWHGLIHLGCRRSGETIYRTFKLTFNSSVPGFGADTNSLAEIFLRLATDTHPDELQLFALIDTTSQSFDLSWDVTTARTQAVFTVQIAQSAAKNSLRKGTLFLRAGRP